MWYLQKFRPFRETVKIWSLFKMKWFRLGVSYIKTEERNWNYLVNQQICIACWVCSGDGIFGAFPDRICTVFGKKYLCSLFGYEDIKLVVYRVSFLVQRGRKGRSVKGVLKGRHAGLKTLSSIFVWTFSDVQHWVIQNFSTYLNAQNFFH